MENKPNRWQINQEGDTQEGDSGKNIIFVYSCVFYSIFCLFYGIPFLKLIFKFLISYKTIISLCEFIPNSAFTIFIYMSISSVIAMLLLYAIYFFNKWHTGEHIEWHKEIVLIIVTSIAFYVHKPVRNDVLEASKIAKAKHIEILFTKDEKSCKFSSDNNEFSGEACGIFDDLEKKIKGLPLDDLKARILELKLKNKDAFLHNENETYRTTTNNEFNLFALQDLPS